MLAIGASLISFSAVFVKLTIVGPTATAFYRVFFGGILLIIPAMIRREKIWRGWSKFSLVLLCGFAFAIDLSFWHHSIQYVGPGLATILGNFQVFFLALFGILVYHENVNWKLGTSFFLAMAGLFLIFGLDWSHLQPQFKIGIIMGLVTAISYAAYVIFIRKIQMQSHGTTQATNLALVSLIAAVFLAIITAISGESFLIPSGKQFGLLFGYAFISQVIGWILISRALPEMPVSQAGLILLLQPGLAFLWDVLFFKRSTSFIEIVGAVLAISAIYLGTVGRKVKKVQPE